MRFINHFSIIFALFAEIDAIPLRRTGDERRLDDKTAFPAALPLDQQERGGAVCGLCKKAQTLWLDAALTHGAEHIREPLGAVDEGEAPAVAQDALRRGAHVLKRAGTFLARISPRLALGARAAAGGEVRRVGDHIVDAAGRGQDGSIAQVARAEGGAPLPAVFRKGPARERCRRRGKFHVFNGEGILARKQERAEQPRAAAKVADAISARGTGKVGEGKAVRSRREEICIIVKAGSILPEFVSPFHASTPFKDKNKDAPKGVVP